jgi:hypothetical protein
VSDEAEIGVSGTINKHRCRIRSCYPPIEHPERDVCLFCTGKHESDRAHVATQVCAVGYKITPFHSLRDMNTWSSSTTKFPHILLRLCSNNCAVCRFTFTNISAPLLPAYILPQYYPMLSHSPFYLSATLDPCFISYMFYHILTRCTSCCYYVILTLVRPGVITSFNVFYSTQGALYTDSYLLYILDKPPYRSVFSSNSDGSRSSLKMADYCRNM